MPPSWLVRSICFLIILSSIPNPAWAYKKDLRLPLAGHQGYFAASGSARFFDVRDEPFFKDQEELTIEIKNVPLPSGTILLVFVGDEMIGTITLDSKRSGNLKLKSGSHKLVPKLDPGTSVTIRLVRGQIVIW